MCYAAENIKLHHAWKRNCLFEYAMIYTARMGELLCTPAWGEPTQSLLSCSKLDLLKDTLSEMEHISLKERRKGGTRLAYPAQSISLYLTVVSPLSNMHEVQLSSVQSLSHVWLFATPWTAAHQASLSITNSQSLIKLKSIESVMPSDHLTLYHPLLLPPSIFPSIRVFSNKSGLSIRWSKYWSFSIHWEYSGLISFRIDWFDLLAVQGTLRSLPQRHSSKASILRHSAFFTVQVSQPYMTTGKTIALTIWTLTIWRSCI